jgi:hypothetical protein
MAVEAEDDNGWQEAGHSGGGRGMTVVQRQRLHAKVMEDGGGRRAGMLIFFSGGVESYLESYIANPIINRV